MATEVILPKLGQTMEQGRIVRWVKGEGERVEKGEVLFEIESDKAVLDVESSAGGFLRKILVPKGVAVPVLTVVALITKTADEDVSGYEARVAGAKAVTPVEGERVEREAAPPPSGPRRAQGRVLASPRARKRGKEAGIDLSLIVGTGPEGRIVERDVLAYLTNQSKATPTARKMATAAGLDLQEVEGSGVAGRIVQEDVERVLAASAPGVPSLATGAMPVAGLRRIIAERMSKSHRTTARVALTTEVDATALVEVRNQLKESMRDELGFRLGYNDLLIKIVAQALREFPSINAQLVGDEIRQLSEVNVGLAVDTERGLVVIVVRHADQKKLLAVASEVRSLAGRAQAGSSLPDDLSGGTFTITNLGMFEVDAFTPIINLPECAILGMGRIKEKPVVIHGDICVRSMMWLSLTFDHRLVDGAPAARFLKRVKELIEQPYLLLA